MCEFAYGQYEFQTTPTAASQLQPQSDFKSVSVSETETESAFGAENETATETDNCVAPLPLRFQSACCLPIYTGRKSVQELLAPISVYQKVSLLCMDALLLIHSKHFESEL